MGTDIPAAVVEHRGVVNKRGAFVDQTLRREMNDTSVGETHRPVPLQGVRLHLRKLIPDQKDNYLQIEGWYNGRGHRSKDEQYYVTGTYNTPSWRPTPPSTRGTTNAPVCSTATTPADGNRKTLSADTAQASREGHFTIQTGGDPRGTCFSRVEKIYAPWQNDPACLNFINRRKRTPSKLHDTRKTKARWTVPEISRSFDRKFNGRCLPEIENEVLVDHNKVVLMSKTTKRCQRKEFGIPTIAMVGADDKAVAFVLPGRVPPRSSSTHPFSGD
ncbi:hypothetical protein QZH41_017172 [Actinostola sp. cb2023]|nr:hypothetical protein QZH41_017172 [Actinostola sp. cb2023]